MNNRLPYLHTGSPGESEESDNIDMTPMLDIVFIMLIFFIVTASFVKEAGIEVNRPAADTSSAQNSNAIMVAISETNAVWINRRKVDARAVRRNIERMSFENPEAIVIIQADKLSQTGLLIKVMDQIKLAGIENVSIATAPEA